jgi:hypothetical protein
VNRAPHGREKSRRRSQAARSNSTSCRPGLDLPPVSVERMRGIDREAIVPNIVAIPALVDGPLARMAIAAERAQRPEHELVVVAAMSRVVIGDGGRRDAALLVTQSAERVLVQLVLGPRSPGLQRVPGPPRQRLGGSKITRVHCYLCGSGRTVGPIPLSGIDAGGSRWSDAAKRKLMACLPAASRKVSNV